MAQSYTISRLAAAAGVNVETVRYYQRRSLMPEPARPANGTRLYRTRTLTVCVSSNVRR